jgi:hypothetical protein
MGRALTEEELRQGFVTYTLIGDWNRWVERRVEQIALVTDSRVERRIGVDFRLHPEVFGIPPTQWGSDPIHFVPLTLLKKAPFMNFDLRDESGAAMPLLTRRKTTAIGAATLCAAAKVFVARRFLAAHGHKLSTSNEELRRRLREGEVRIDAIQLPPELPGYFSELCSLPYQREDYESGHPTAEEVWTKLIKRTMAWGTDVTGRKVTNWVWLEDEQGWSAPDEDETSWLHALLSDRDFSQLAYDFSRLYMVCAPVKYEENRRRVLKIQYEEHLIEPGLRELELARRAIPFVAKALRRIEDSAEGLRPDHKNAQREWIISDSVSNREARRPGIYRRLRRGIGWLGKPLTFDLPGLGFGGSFHLEFAAPDGTQIRRGRLRAKRPRGDVRAGSRPREEFARRYARNVSRCHLYFGQLPPGASGEAVVAIKPGPATIVRGAALSSLLTTGLVLYAFFASSDLAKRPATVVALLLLAPGLVAAQLARPNEHPMTTGMLLGLRLLALGVAGVAAGTAALLGAQQTPDEACVPWAILLGVTIGLTLILLRSWRLAGRDWPLRELF